MALVIGATVEEPEICMASSESPEHAESPNIAVTLTSARALRIFALLHLSLALVAALAADADLGESFFEVPEDATPMDGGVRHVALQVVDGLVLLGLLIDFLVVVEFGVLGAQ